jgi:cell wall-associated NlpC family hydrolase
MESSHTKRTTPLTGVELKLNSQLKEWYAVRYKLGGMSKQGIDCSGFVYLTFHNKFGVKLPRTTAKQVTRGRSIAKENLKAGDLVFFKATLKVRHVGIYSGNGEFIHASTSRGVMRSRLSNPYWKKHYWTAKRIKI